jgi:hypothetical protein
LVYDKPECKNIHFSPELKYFAGCYGGDNRIRTDDGDFADLCLRPLGYVAMTVTRSN